MRIVSKIQKYQMGGAAPAPEEDPAAAQGAPAEGGAPAGPEGPEQGGGEDPMAQILQVAAQAVQTQNCEAAMAVCQALMQIAQGGGGAPEQAPEEPTFARHGAKLVKVRR